MILKKGDKLGQVAGALKKGGLEPPYELCKGCWFFEWGWWIDCQGLGWEELYKIFWKAVEWKNWVAKQKF